MTSIRYRIQNTEKSKRDLINIINAPTTTSVVLFASPATPDTNYSQTTNGSDSNLPLLSALATVELPGFEPIKLVYDGNFLTAARRQRFLEVAEVMDAAQTSSKVAFSSQRLQFTSSLDPVEAANIMEATSALVCFTKSTRAQYFSLLSNLAESEYE